jgi:glycosyltransferase involved in cell wall biosynthesis
MSLNILYILADLNIFGGTPKKTLDIIKYSNMNRSIVYTYKDKYKDYIFNFEDAGAVVYQGIYGRNIFKHIIKLISIMDNEHIQIVQTQFTMGEFLGFLIKIFRPNIKIICAFVTPLKTTLVKSILSRIYYKYFDYFVYVSKYVKKEKQSQLNVLTKKNGKVIYNGTDLITDEGGKFIKMKKYSLLDVAGLLEWKNIQILIEALNILVNQKNLKNIHLYIAGDGPYRPKLEMLIGKYDLYKYVFLMGYQSNIGKLLKGCDVFVHPAYAEGFGIAVVEAMMAEKPIIISNAGALPELIEHKISGLVVDPYNAEQWVDAIEQIIDNEVLTAQLVKNAKERAHTLFSVEKFVYNYQNLYKSLLDNRN